MFLSTYVMSDVHSFKDRYDAMLETLALQNKDTLFVLRDVIDRGRGGIVILLDIMNRDNVYILLGNRGYMMKQYYEAMHHMIADIQEVWVVTDHWQRNRCSPTIDTFECLNERKQRELLDYLGELSIAICDLKVHEKLFYLTHGSAQPQFTHGIVTQQDVEDSNVTMERFVWDRMDVHECLFDDRSVIVGHTPALFFQGTHPYAIRTGTGDVKVACVMDIDCGCTANDIHSRLGVICPDTRAVQYFQQRVDSGIVSWRILPVSSENEVPCMLRTGDFSKLSRISIRMPRYYEKHNLLKPRYVDEEGGYRSYAHEQIFEAAKIWFLREAGFSVAMMEEIIAQYDSPQEIQRYFQIRTKELEEERQRISDTLIRLERAQRLLDTEDTFMKYTVEVKQIKGMYAATLRSIIPTYEREDLVWKRMYSVFVEKYLDITFAQPQNLRAYLFDEGFIEKNVDIEIATEVVGSYEDAGGICFRQLKNEMVVSVTFTGDYNQITEVCMAITMWTKENGYELGGANFCIYHKGWGQYDNPKEFVTEICFPIRK